MSNPVYSHHIFICPFRIDDDDFNFKSYNPGGDWQPFLFKINSARDYNERVYFYDFVYDALFEEGVENRPLKQYSIKEYENREEPKFYNILGSFENEKKENENKIYSLQIDNVTLNVYETGIAIFAFHLNNWDYPRIEDIKRINDLGRRMYPQFLIDNLGNPEILNGSFIPLNLSISNKKFNSYEEWHSQDESIITQEDFSKYIKFDKGFGTTKKDSDLVPSTINHFLTKDNSSHNYCPLIDDRMFVLSYIGDEAINNIIFPHLIDENKNKVKDVLHWRCSEDWHNLLFCDHVQNGNHKSNNLRCELNKAHTYYRWEGDGTLIGVTKDSFIALTDGGYFADFTRTHCMTMYFQMVQLCLVQRASILKFSSDAAKLAGDIDSNVTDSDLEKLKKLQISYIRFMNRLHYREVTAQEQGIDLYTMLQEKMRIPAQLEELDDEIKEMVNLAELQISRRLNIIAIIYLPLSLLVGILGMNTLPGTNNGNLSLWGGSFDPTFILSIVYIAVVGTLMYYLFKKIIK